MPLRQISFKVINTPTTGGTDYTPIMAPDIGDISAGHSPTPVPTLIEAAVLEDIHHAPLSATTAAHTTLLPMDSPITPHTLIPTGIVMPYPTFTTSPADTTHTTPQTRASLTPATPTAQYKDLSPEMSSNAPDPQHPINPTAPRLSPSRIPLQILHQIMIVTLIIETRTISQ